MQSQAVREPRRRDLVPGQCFSGVYPVWKERGETLADLLVRFRTAHDLDETAKLTYAGRLDPMAEGIVLILAGESRFEKDALLGLPKIYEVEVLLGIATDTLDPLGLITRVDIPEIDRVVIESVVEKMHAITTLPYPLYSSVPVDGTPLFVHARAGNTVSVPNKKVTIHRAALMNIQKIQFSTLIKKTIPDIEKVSGDFRQTDIIKTWEMLQREYPSNTEVQLVTIGIHASSGTYMRSLAEWLGQQIGIPAIAYSIKRIKIGEYEATEKPR